MVDQQVVHDTPCHSGSKYIGLADRQHGSVVRSDALDESQRVSGFYPESHHVGNIEHTDAVHNGHVSSKYRCIDRMLKPANSCILAPSAMCTSVNGVVFMIYDFVIYDL